MNFQYWFNYFQNNQSHFGKIDWDIDDALSQEEKRWIATSLQQFQRGESSEGKHLFAFAKAFSNPSYLECIKLFIREEQKHAWVLKRYMDKHSLPTIKRHWIDVVFRKLRKLSGIFNIVVILLIAEIIAKVYYKALFKSTRSTLLQNICIQILQDEEAHIAFQCHTLQEVLLQRRTTANKLLVTILYPVLMSGTIVMVWLYHKAVLKRGGYSFPHFYNVTMEIFNNCKEVILLKEISFKPILVLKTE